MIQGIPINLRSLIQAFVQGPSIASQILRILWTRLKRSVQSTSEAGPATSDWPMQLPVNQQAQLDRERSKAISEEERLAGIGEAVLGSHLSIY